MISEITRTKMRNAKIGRKLPEKTKQKMSISKIGRKISLDTRHKISIAHLGKKQAYNTGEKNNNWKGGLTSFYDSLKTSAKYKEWRKKVYLRDEYTCKNCGDPRGGNLEAHHIKTFTSILRENNIKTIEQAILCEELWNMDNGITLCKDCHKKTDNYAGKGEKKNTRFRIVDLIKK